MSKSTHKALIISMALGAVFFSGASVAAVTETEAANLGKELTPFGAERAGNKDGSIPEWKGCPNLNAPMDQLKAGDRRWDPYADEKPLYTVTAENMSQYADKLSDGVRALLQKYPDTMKLPVYATHRNHCAPEWVYQATAKNAVEANLVVDGDKEGVQGAVNGVPFPIPKNGAEVRWNHASSWRGESYESKLRLYSMTSAGDRVLGGQAMQYDQFEAYRKGISAQEYADKGYLGKMTMQSAEAPSFRAGEGVVVRDTTNYTKYDRQSWQYLVGQRRVRRAPNLGWDTPDFLNSGANFFDEVFGSFLLGQERHEFKLVGKKEVLIPYNNNKLFSLKEDEIFLKNHHNPDAIRWELHRVWVLEATLKPGKRHAVSKRVFYVDEDTWSTSLMDGWDPSGKLWRVSLFLNYYLPDMPGMMSSFTDILYVLDGVWSSRHILYEPGYQLKAVPMKPDSVFTPDALTGRGIR
ncbi:DUF1329 domain-containing protein [Pseudomonas aeruginosa]|uniref:DUF1329 domain-containing protein n=1 Tax=Pseudomonas TaxID=286 RepID=UPI0015531747|nr:MULTISPECIES: DUF1329 domain-containing protein [Pseudomonas]MCK2119953.1 DUF1329 domain-containing protein [Pseudomonas sp. PNPG3]QKF01641.1 DUF1329 domain-containing protein [Pseudomonas aeruginosa]HCF1525210.1 DUF1329 domain-containing protein [Pseudomonas aeruginosa]HEP8861205.1 DUF1329 domain-containing protein [Pseudomonas aeruginosa]